jgi:murein DD-endopeptidase MepM/ murein hydrolase activator NlpD
MLKNKIFYLIIGCICISIAFFKTNIVKDIISSVDAPKIIISSGTIIYGQNLYSVLEKENVNPRDINPSIKSLNTLFPIRGIREGHKYIVEKSTDNSLLCFKYMPTKIDTYMVVSSTTGIFNTIHKKENLEKEIVFMQGTITSSLYEAMLNSEDGDPALAVEFADLFSWQIDFFTEPREGDTFRLIWEKFKSKRGYSVNGKILIAEYKNKNTTHTAIFFNNGTENGDYYDLDGKSMRKAFLRAPLNYRRISSYFTHKRFHPILKYFRPHLGIDYAAPTGTPIVSVGDGKVISAGWGGGFGKIVKIRHANSNYETWYGHLSRYGKGIRSGTHVSQGQVIGYVGATGTATGPHLDFRVKKNGSFVNYLSIKFPPAKSVDAKYMQEFSTLRDNLLNQLNDSSK